jgi:hypothetical protein
MCVRVVPFSRCSNTGFLCLVIYRRDTHVVELQIGNLTSRLEDACAPDKFDAARTPFTTLLGEFVVAATAVKVRRVLNNLIINFLPLSPHLSSSCIAGRHRSVSHKRNVHANGSPGTAVHDVAPQAQRQQAAPPSRARHGRRGCAAVQEPAARHPQLSQRRRVRAQCAQHPRPLQQPAAPARFVKVPHDTQAEAASLHRMLAR